MALRYLIEDSSDILKAATNDDDIVPPPGHTAVAATTIAAAYDGVILLGGTWDGTTYTPPAGYVAPFDPTSASGAIKQKAHDMLDVFDAAIGLILSNQHAWPSGQYPECPCWYPLADCCWCKNKPEQYPNGRT